MSENVEKGEIVVDGQNVVELQQLGISLMAVEDKIIVMFDDYKSGYECKNCKGKGIAEGCEVCANSGKDRFGQDCKFCLGKGKDYKKRCTECKGKGHLIFIPETAKSLPTTGVVVSMGPETRAMILTKNILENKKLQKNYAGTPKYDEYLAILADLEADLKETPIRLGARVIFGPYVGTLIPFKGNIKLKIMRVHEPLAVLFGKDTASRDFIDYETENY